jgi:hypothetical protein
MKAIVQDRYGSADVLALRELRLPWSGTTTCSSGYTRPIAARTSGT